MKSYLEIFGRPKVTTDPWVNPLKRSPSEDRAYGRLGQLHRDVFSHHHQPESMPHFIESLLVQRSDASRIISLDNLTDYYLNSNLPVDAPLIESRHLNDDHDLLGESRCTFEEFLKAVTDIPFEPRNVDHGSLGGNRLCYLFGNVGVGKSFLCARLVAKLRRYRDESGYEVVPLRICFESLSRSGLIDLNRIDVSFFIHLLGEIEDHAWRGKKDPRVSAPPATPDMSEKQLYSLIGEYILQLARHKIRIVLILDNIDGFHYRYSRFVFFSTQYEEFIKTLDATLVKLCNVFADETFLGNYGLCILVVARENVARDFLLSQADPERITFEDHRTFWLTEVDPKQIIESRYKLLDAAAQEIVKSGAPLIGQDRRGPNEALEVVRSLMINSASKSSEGLGVIWQLCHHGHRSLVDFIGRLRINYYSQREIHERLFGDNPHNLERLYITNLKRRYSQSMNHFPNLFLCDAWVNPENIQNGVQCEHRHTYWLKYLILKYVDVQSQKRNSVTGDEIIRLFSSIGYEDRLVRLSLGSLCMVNESRCIEISGSAETHIEHRPIRLTSRGRVLIDGSGPRKGIPYCFDISYLQLVTDDFWLSIPLSKMEEIFVEGSLAYTLAVGEQYQKGVSKYLIAKIPASLKFLRLIECGWHYEEKKFLTSLATLSLLKPDFDRIYRSLLETSLAIVEKSFGGAIRFEENGVGRSLTAAEIRKMAYDLRRDESYYKPFDELLGHQCLVVS